MDKLNVENALLKSYCRWELSTNFVKMVATNHKVPNLNLESLNVLSYDCTYRLFMVLDNAKKIANQSKREHLRGSDIIAALKILDYDDDDLYGCSYSQMNYQLQTTSSSNQIVGPGGGGTRPAKGMLSYVDKEFDLESFLSQPPLKLPREIMIHEHWLAINSVVPDIPENTPQLSSNNVQALEVAECTAADSYSYNSMSGLNHSINICAPFNSVTAVAQPMTVFSDKVPLLIERQLVYKDLTESCFGQNELKKKEALHIMSTDLVMKELTPHFACFIRETTKINVQKPNLGILLNCVRMIKAIFDNIHLKQEFMQNHLFYFVPALLNCIISRKMCVKPDSENHWALRCFASKTVANICLTFQNSLPSLSLRVCKIAKQVIECCQALTDNEQCLVDINYEQSAFVSTDGIINGNFDDESINEDILNIDEKNDGKIDEDILKVNAKNDEISSTINLEDVENDSDLDSIIMTNVDSHKKTCAINLVNFINLNDSNNLNDSIDSIDVDAIPFSSYYGAATLLFDMGVNVVNLTLLPLLPKLSRLIEVTLQSDSAAHHLAIYEANHLKDLLIKQAKYIITTTNILRISEDIDDYCKNYGKYLGPFIFREVIPSGCSSIEQRSHTPSGIASIEKRSHMLSEITSSEQRSQTPAVEITSSEQRSQTPAVEITSSEQRSQNPAVEITSSEQRLQTPAVEFESEQHENKHVL